LKSGCFTFDVISKTMPKNDILGIKSKEILLILKIIRIKHTDINKVKCVKVSLYEYFHCYKRCYL